MALFSGGASGAALRVIFAVASAAAEVWSIVGGEAMATSSSSSLEALCRKNELQCRHERPETPRRDLPLRRDHEMCAVLFANRIIII